MNDKTPFGINDSGNVSSLDDMLRALKNMSSIINCMSSVMKHEDMYYVAFDRNDVIWGAGVSEKSALRDGKKQTRAKLITVRCDKNLFLEVSENGYCHGEYAAYWYYDDVEALAKLIPNDPKNNGSIFKKFNQK